MTTPPAEARLQQIVEQMREAVLNANHPYGLRILAESVMKWADDLVALLREGRAAKEQETKVGLMFRFERPYSVAKMPIEEFLIGMCSLGTPQEVQMVGTFGKAADDGMRTAHRDVDLPFHRDGIYTQALADMQRGQYVEKPNVDIVGLYCVRDNEEPCFTTISEDGQTELAAVNLRAGEALIMDNRLWHGRRGVVGQRLLIRFWTTAAKSEDSSRSPHPARHEP